MSTQIKHLTVPELKEIAKGQGVKGVSKMNRPELLEKIDEAKYLAERESPKEKYGYIGEFLEKCILLGENEEEKQKRLRKIERTHSIKISNIRKIEKEYVEYAENGEWLVYHSLDCAENDGRGRKGSGISNEEFRILEEYLLDEKNIRLVGENHKTYSPVQQIMEKSVHFVPRYTPQSAFFWGNTKPYKETFKHAGCKFIISQDFGAGWVSQRSHLLEVMDALDKAEVPYHF